MAERARHTAAVERIQTTLELLAIGEAMLRQRLRRESPSASEADIERAVRAWYDLRPGAELGDAPGRPRDIPRQ